MRDTRETDNWGRFTDETRRVVITGIGPITASGIGVDAFWAGLQARPHGDYTPPSAKLDIGMSSCGQPTTQVPEASEGALLEP